MDEVAASSAPEDTREAARSCVGPAANVSSDSLDEVWNAAAEVLGGDALDFLTARVSGLVGGLRELEAAAVTAEGAEADGKAASEGSCSAMSLVVASAALLLAARV
ncbi:putative Glutamic acid alanine rich protein of Trypanosoma [Trypanosoma vivax]|nr:putative Glutamic acid alanine rich protein of Trypanosoma [Trypanosoma vivax]KAH8616585.1 putative Glutamic acid alanine rich protein of Trypanosoma [Trypanosoma vivax]KAH8616620.1 putative Glutamic acid alanine rich protein of Trypanosoma [Trypanosoma vivax]KAH8616672.1 putative Glutamic acid alanine rich protein of Trypanosoma [Trypanosoma vivax]